jgi:hypothetical protein
MEKCWIPIDNSSMPIRKLKAYAGISAWAFLVKQCLAGHKAKKERSKMSE